MQVNADGSPVEPEPENVIDIDGVELFNSDEPLRDHSDLHVLDMGKGDDSYSKATLIFYFT